MLARQTVPIKCNNLHNHTFPNVTFGDYAQTSDGWIKSY